MKRSHCILPLLALSAILLLSPSCRPSQPVEDDSGTDSPVAPPAPAPVHDATLPGFLPDFTNLQVLPDDISKDELKERMKLITRSLGTKCDHCHLTDVEDYASDEVREKVVAREMMRMVQRINQELLTWEDAPEATCFMCHHGQLKPQMEPDK